MPQIMKIVLGQPREQTRGDLEAAVDFAQKRPGVAANHVAVTSWC
jgi:dienelactone hydrolase